MLRHRLEAWRELWRRYRDSFAFFWEHRHQMQSLSFEAQEAEFLPAALSLQEAPVSPVGRWVARLLMLIVIALLLWSYFGRVDIVVTANGKIIPSAYTQTLASVDVAAVRAIHVKEGQLVKRGEVLVELDTTSPDAERDKATAQWFEARLQLARAQALLDALAQAKPPRLPPREAFDDGVLAMPVSKWLESQSHLQGQYSEYLAKLARIDSDITRFKAGLPLAEQRAVDFKVLAQNGDIARHEYLEREQARIDLAGQLDGAKEQRRALIEETRRTALDAMNEATRQLDAAKQDAFRAGERGKLLKLSAPMDGIVHQLSVHTVGGVVPSAQPLMQIVPQQHELEVEATLENRDVGFIQSGQPASVKVEAFEYTKYGVVPAVVSHVSSDAVQDEKRGLLYTVRVRMERNTLAVDGKPIELSPGMAVSVEIKTGRRRVVEYVLAPLLQHGRESLRER